MNFDSFPHQASGLGWFGTGHWTKEQKKPGNLFECAHLSLRENENPDTLPQTKRAPFFIDTVLILLFWRKAQQTSLLLYWTLLTKTAEKKWWAQFYNWSIQCNQLSIYPSELFWQMWNVFKEATIFTVQLGNHYVKAMPALH